MSLIEAITACITASVTTGVLMYWIIIKVAEWRYKKIWMAHSTNGTDALVKIKKALIEKYGEEEFNEALNNAKADRDEEDLR